MVWSVWSVWSGKERFGWVYGMDWAVRVVWIVRMGMAWSGYGCEYACARLGWSEPEPDQRVLGYNAWRPVPLSALVVSMHACVYAVDDYMRQARS